MAADWLPGDWSVPQLLLAALVVTVAITGVVAASTSQTAFSTYNAAWDGASDLQNVASEGGADAVVALNTTKYAETDPNGTVAVVLSPDEPYTPRERDRIASFVKQGGTLVLAEDFGSHTTPLLSAVGAQSRPDGAPLRDEQEYYRSPALPVATNVTEAPETEGVDQLTLNHGTTLRTDPTANNTTVLVASSEFAYLDTDRNGALDESEELASRPVVVREQVGDGTVYAVSDPSILINAMLERPGNVQFARQLFDRETVLLDYSHLTGQPPLAIALLTLRGSPLWQVAAGTVGIGAVVWSRRLQAVALDIGDRFGRSERPTDQLSLADADPDEIVAHLARRNPEWDEQRLRRVMRGVIRAGGGTSGDE